MIPTLRACDDLEAKAFTRTKRLRSQPETDLKNSGS